MDIHGHQLLFSRFIHVTFESDNPQWLTDYGTLFYSIQYSWLPNLWEKVTSGRTDKFGWWLMALWDWGRIWGLVGASLWLRSATRLVNTLHYLMSLFKFVEFSSVCPQALSTVCACGDLGRLLIAAALKMANCRVISQPGKLPRNQSFPVPICLHLHLIKNLNFWQQLSSSQIRG